MPDILQFDQGITYNRVPGSYIQGTGIVDAAGFQITADGPGNTTFSITAGAANFVSHNGTDRIVNQVVYPGGTAITPTFLTSSGFTSLGINSSGAIVQKSQEFFSPAEVYGGVVPIGGLAHVNLSTITGVVGVTSLMSTTSLLDYTKQIGVAPTYAFEDCVFTPNANLTFDYSGGTLGGVGIQRLTNPAIPDTVVQPAETPVTNFAYSWSGGTNVGQNAIDPNQYDNNGVLTPVPVGEATIQVLLKSGSTGSTFVAYGDRTIPGGTIFGLNSKETVRSNPVIKGLARSFAVRGYVIVEGGATNLADENQCIFVEATKEGQI